MVVSFSSMPQRSLIFITLLTITILLAFFSYDSYHGSTHLHEHELSSVLPGVSLQNSRREQFWARNLQGKLKVIKTRSDRSVYVLDQSNIRHVIPDWSTFLSLGYDVNDIVTISDEKMKEYELGDPLHQIAEERTPPNPYAGCPCINNAQYLVSLDQQKAAKKEQAQHAHEACIVDNSASKEFLAKYNQLHKSEHALHYRIIPSNYTQSNYSLSMDVTDDLKTCDVVLQFTRSKTLYKYTCPEQCAPKPFALVSLSWFDEKTQLDPTLQDTPLTCSMTWKQLFTEGSHHHKLHQTSGGEGGDGTKHKAFEHASISLTLKAIIRRRIEECFEREYWTTGESAIDVHKGSSISKRQVHGFILWVGTRSRYDLIFDQIQTLAYTTKFYKSNSTNTNKADKDMIAGWIASEDEYPCRVGTTVCEAVTSSNAYYRFMPTTRMNVASSGWSCAQRRPLRAMTHITLLYDMNYLLVVDDDTYVNVAMMRTDSFHSYVVNKLMKEYLVLGQLTKGKKITKRGFYYGGAGYLIGKKVIDRLNSHEILGPAESMNAMIDPNQMALLSILNQAYPLSQHFCKGCIRLDNSTANREKSASQVNKLANPEEMTKYYDVVGNSSVRLIELCSNIMSQEHTCYHSDHAISRCYIHGAYASPNDIDCGGTQVTPNLKFAMCMGTGDCNPKFHLTCHRWRPFRQNPDRAYNLYAPSNESNHDHQTPVPFFDAKEQIYARSRSLREIE